MRKLLVLACVLTLAVVAAGCGSSSGSDGDKDPTTTTTKAETTTTTTDDGDGGDGGGDVEPTDVTAEEYVAAFTTGMSSGKAEDGELVLPAEAAACLAPKFVDLVTVETLNQAGITAEDAADPGFDPASAGLDADQAQTLVDGYGECGFDIVSELATALTMGLDDAVVACAQENIDPDLAEAALVEAFSTGESGGAFEDLLTDLQTTCKLPAD